MRHISPENIFFLSGNKKIEIIIAVLSNQMVNCISFYIPRKDDSLHPRVAYLEL